MKRYKVVITLSSGEQIEKVTSNPNALLDTLSKTYPQKPEYHLLEILGLTPLVKGYIESVTAELL